MAFNTYYTTTVTTLEGNTLVYKLEKDDVSVTPSFLNITENSYEFEYFFNDVDGAGIGIGFLSKIITLEFFGDTEINLIKSNPEDWRLTVTLDGDSIFVGFPDVQSINEYALPSYTDLYKCDFVNAHSSLLNEPSVYLGGRIDNNSNNLHTTNQIPISDLFAEFVTGYNTDLSKNCFISHKWISENSNTERTPPPTWNIPLEPNLRLIFIDPSIHDVSIGEVIAQICKGFMIRAGYSYLHDKTLILHHIEGSGGTLSGYNCPYTSSGIRSRSASTISLQTINSNGSDFIVKDDGYSSENPIFPSAINCTNGYDISSSILNPNQFASIYFDEPYEIENWWKTNLVCTVNSQGMSVYARDDINNVFIFEPLDQVYNVNPSSLSTLYQLNEAVTKRTGSDYLFTEGLKGFRIQLNKILDPMIPISYDSKVWITPSGTVNLYEETMECLLVEIQDNG